MEIHPVFVAVLALGILVILGPCLGSWVKLKVCSSCVVAVGCYSHRFACRNLFCMVEVYLCKLCLCMVVVCVLPTTGDGIEGHNSPSANTISVILWINVKLQPESSRERTQKTLLMSTRRVVSSIIYPLHERIEIAAPPSTSCLFVWLCLCHKLLRQWIATNSDNLRRHRFVFLVDQSQKHSHSLGTKIC